MAYLKKKDNTWLAALNRLSTKDRLQNWRVSLDSSCLLCSTSTKTRTHLFFSYPFSQDISSAFSPSYHPFPLAFESIITWMDFLPRRITKIVKLTFQASLYTIWWERNNRLFGSTSKTSSSIIVDISRIVRNKLFIMDIIEEKSSHSRSDDSNMVLWFRHFQLSN